MVEAVGPGGLSASCTVEVAAGSWTQSCSENAQLRSNTSYTKVVWLSDLHPVTLEVQVRRDGAVLVEQQGKVTYVDHGPVGCQEKCEIGEFIVAE